MYKYIAIIKNSYTGYWNYLKNKIITINQWDNFFYGLIAISLLYIPMAIISGFDVRQAVLFPVFSITIRHLHHVNLGRDYNILKYVTKTPNIHIWHRAKKLPKKAKYSLYFGLTLSVWDSIFNTNHVPFYSKTIAPGLSGDDDFPKAFIHQKLHLLKFKNN